MPPLNVNISSVQEIPIFANPQRADGSTATLVGTPAWTSSDTTIATVSPATDGLSAVIIAQAPGTCTVTVSGEGDPTPGVDPVSNTVSVTVVNAEATQIALTAGTAVNKPTGN